MKISNKKKKFRKIRIISSNYIITYHKELNDKKGNLDGRISETWKEILVRDGMPYQRTLQVIMHESMHGIRFEMCLNGNVENRNILLTTGVTCFIRDNPEFIMEYIRILNGGKD